jgi:hypothetical protein
MKHRGQLLQISIVLLTALLLFTCQKASKVPRFVITGHGSDKPDPICKADLTTTDIKEFFDKAKPITAQTMHDDYNYMSCWVEGKTITPSGTATWKIHPIGVAEVTLPDHTQQLLGCNTCDELFR